MIIMPHILRRKKMAKKNNVVQDNPFDETIMTAEWKGINWFLNNSEELFSIANRKMQLHFL